MQEVNVWRMPMDTPDDLMLICAGSPIGALSVIMPGFGSSKTAGRSLAILIEAPGVARR